MASSPDRRARTATVLAVLLAWSLLPGPASAAAGPVVRFVDPPPGGVVPVVDRYRFGWTEADGDGAIFSRTVAVNVSEPTSDCQAAAYTVVSTDKSSNRPDTYSVAGLAPGACASITLTVSDTHGNTAIAQSGFVHASAAGRSGPRPDFSLPAAGATTVVSGVGYYRVAWDEGTSGIVERTLEEERGTPPSSADCGEVTAWVVTRQLDPIGPAQAVDGLEAGPCYRFRITLTDRAERTRSALSGAFQVAQSPPACEYGDVLAGEGATPDYQRTLLDSTYRLPPDYRPDDLVNTSTAGLTPGSLVRSIVIGDLTAMAAAAKAAGAPLSVISAYRTYASQVATYAALVRREGIEGGLVSAARPGHSEHQLGTAIDFGSAGPLGTTSSDWGLSIAGKWLKANAWQYGFVLSYPAEATALTCYKYEPWHYRYVGRPLAATLHELGTTLRQYLWLHRGVAAGD